MMITYTHTQGVTSERLEWHLAGRWRCGSVTNPKPQTEEESWAGASGGSGRGAQTISASQTAAIDQQYIISYLKQHNAEKNDRRSGVGG